MVAMARMAHRRAPGMTWMVCSLTLIQVVGAFIVHGAHDHAGTVGGICLTCAGFALLSIATSVAAIAYLVRDP